MGCPWGCCTVYGACVTCRVREVRTYGVGELTMCVTGRVSLSVCENSRLPQGLWGHPWWEEGS